MLRLLKMLVLPLVAGSMIAGKHSTRSYLLQDSKLSSYCSCEIMLRLPKLLMLPLVETAAAALTVWADKQTALHKAQLLATRMHVKRCAVLGPKSGDFKCWLTCFSHTRPACCDSCKGWNCCKCLGQMSGVIEPFVLATVNSPSISSFYLHISEAPATYSLQVYQVQSSVHSSDAAVITRLYPFPKHSGNR